MEVRKNGIVMMGGDRREKCVKKIYYTNKKQNDDGISGDEDGVSGGGDDCGGDDGGGGVRDNEIITINGHHRPDASTIIVLRCTSNDGHDCLALAESHRKCTTCPTTIRRRRYYNGSLRISFNFNNHHERYNGTRVSTHKRSYVVFVCDACIIIMILITY